MIVNKYANGGGSGSGSTDLSGYWNSAETQVHIDSAVTPVSEHLFDVEQVTASALTELHDGLLEVSARTVDMSGFYTSAQTDEKIASAASITYASAVSYTDAALADFSLDGYYTSGQTDAAIALAVAPFYTSAQTDEVITQAVSGLATEQYVQDALSGVNLDAYYTSAQTEDAISAATSGKADAVNIQPNTGGKFSFPRWNSQGIITGEADGRAYQNDITINGVSKSYWGRGNGNPAPFYAPLSAGTAGDILVSTGNGAPVWSAVTMPDMSEYYTSAQTEDAISSALIPYYTSAQTNIAISAATQDMVTSTDVKHIVKLTQAAYDQLVLDDEVDPYTFYIIVSQSS